MKYLHKFFMCFLIAAFSSGFTWAETKVAEQKKKEVAPSSPKSASESLSASMNGHTEPPVPSERFTDSLSSDTSLVEGAAEADDSSSEDNDRASAEAREKEAELVLDARTEIAQVQSQIDDMLAANQQMKDLHDDQIVEIQRINDQTRIHRRLLEQLVKGQHGSRMYQPTDVDEILRQEKIRLIRNVTQNNHKYLSKIPRGNSSYTR